MIRGLVSLLLCLSAASAAATTIEEAARRWETHPHGPLMARTLPPSFPAARVPEPASPGAKLLLRYCVQCHYLPNPAMHDAERWPKVVARMVGRMQGAGNLGAVMKEMMAGVAAPAPEEAATLVAYLKRHAMQPVDPAHYPDLRQPAAQSFRLACAQCHALPDPKRYRAREWPAVVARMESNMAWMNRVIGSSSDPREPQLSIPEINAYLARHARR